MGGRGARAMSGSLFVGDDNSLSDADATRLTPWTPETYPGIWLPYDEWNNVRRAINASYENEEDAIPYERSKIKIGKVWYHYEVVEYDDYIILRRVSYG